MKSLNKDFVLSGGMGKSTNSARAGLLPISLERAPVGAFNGIPVYLRKKDAAKEGAENFSLYTAQGVRFTQGHRQRLIEQDQVEVIVGDGNRSDIGLALIPTVQRAEVPLMSVSGATGLVEPVRDRAWVFKSTVNDTEVIARLLVWRVAGPDARFVANFARLGFHQGFALSVSLPAIVGHQRAAEPDALGALVRHGDHTILPKQLFLGGNANGLAGAYDFPVVALAPMMRGQGFEHTGVGKLGSDSFHVLRPIDVPGFRCPHTSAFSP
jgi:hypothetical protein